MTSRFQNFIAPARLRPELWRLVLGLGLIVAVYVIGVIAVIAGGWLLAGDASGAMGWAQSLATSGRPADAYILFATFIGMFAGPLVAARLLHGRRAGSVFGPAARTLRHFVMAAGLVLALYGLALVPWAFLFDARPGLDPTLWAALLPFTVLALLVQTGAEELLFRGYLMQQLGARFRSPFLWLVLPALVFGVLHYNPGLSGGNTLFVIGSATLFGLFAGDLTARTGSIGAAWGFHFANNFLAVALLSTQGTISGLNLYETPYSIADLDGLEYLLLGNLALVVLGWWLIRRALQA